MAYTIYLRTNKVNGMQYVGETENFRRREWEWKCLKKNYANWYITEERNKYGLENFNVVIIDHCETEEEAYDLEQKYIKELGTKYPDGYNMGDGGLGQKGVKPSEETRRKMSEKAKGRKHSEEWKKNMSKKMNGKNNPMYGKKNRKDISKPVKQFTKDGKFIAEYPSASEAARILNIFTTSIIACCRNRPNYKTYKGFIWRYA